MKSTSLKLSVTLLVINDQVNIKKCLSAVRSIADEIIVAVDDQTTDDTFSVARKYTPHVFKVAHLDNFHLNKIKANNKAKYPWILQLDSDEFVTKQLATEIKQLLAGNYFGYDSWQSPWKSALRKLLPFLPSPRPLTQPAAAYYLPRTNYFLGRYLRHGGQYPDPVIRLFQKSQARLPGVHVHEQMEVDGIVGWMKGDLDHYATPEFSRYLVRENRYSSLTASELYAQGVKINPVTFIDYFLLKPFITFFMLYFRHRGILDGFPGFVFSLFSAIHFQLSYMKLWEIYKNK